ncbi:MAG TPA: hemolysin family protein [Chitinophagales bacterium]|nr:hemolysin family protein [Chitinophagales bacterium]MCB9074918.1 HlyC/CorC family transporter [Chitinophagales bacterium]HMU98147.1 hemolysin family protein [Chitinophagales bacterium]HMV02688.1 hemolysin family protein [Chitinophagales bacterium]HMW94718.1 hemolysin family protein [Chitinophagales bacterium]
MLFLLFIIIIVSILSGIEAIFQTTNRLKIELSYQKGDYTGIILNDYIKNPSKYDITITLGIYLLLVIFSIVSFFHFLPLIDILGVPFALAGFILILINTSIFLLLGVYIPKSIFKLFSDNLLPIFIYPFNVLHWILQPISVIVQALIKFTLSLFGIKNDTATIFYAGIDTDSFIKEHNIEEDNDDDNNVDQEFLENVLDLKNLKARDCMVPRREISAISKTGTIDALKEIIVKTNHSRILVYDESIDKIIGYIHHFDLHKKPKDILSILIPIKIIPETIHIKKLLNDFIKDQKSIAWVVDEYGGTAGVITLEDILEEIFGEIDDEYDKDEFIENQLSANEYILSGRLEIDYINKEFDLNLPEGDYDTISGFIIEHYETIPKQNEIIEIGNYIFKILNVSETKIETVKLEVKQK